MSPKDDDITWAIVLQHMQGMEQRLSERIDGTRTELKGDINSLRTELKGDLNRIERKVDIALVQIGNLDQRLDDIEVVQVPKLKKAVGMR